MKFSREYYVELMTFGRVDRPMFCELFGPLVGLEAEWRAQGAAQDELDLVAFDFDYVPVTRPGVNLGPIGGQRPRVIEETPEHVISTDAFGRHSKLYKRSATIALPLEFPVADMDDWQRLKPMFRFEESRIDWGQVQAARAEQVRGTLVVGGMPGGFDFARNLMGEEVACMAYHDQPELMHDVLETIGELAEQAYARVCERVALDQLSVHEDFAGKSGPLVGPRQIDDFIGPCYRRVWDVVRSHGTRLFDIDSDGDCNPVLDALAAAGINSMHPNEPAAGMDIVAIRERFGRRLALKGGLDKHVLRRGRDEIRAELEYKLAPALRETGTAFGLDHRIPNGTPLENYRYYVATAREMLGLPPLDGRRRGWARMAF